MERRRADQSAAFLSANQSSSLDPMTNEGSSFLTELIKIGSKLRTKQLRALPYLVVHGSTMALNGRAVSCNESSLILKN